MTTETQKPAASEATRVPATPAPEVFYLSDGAGSFLSVDMSEGHVTNYTLGARAEALTFPSREKADQFVVDHLLPSSLAYVVEPGPGVEDPLAVAAANVAHRQAVTDGRVPDPDLQKHEPQPQRVDRVEAGGLREPLVGGRTVSANQVMATSAEPPISK